MERGRANDPGTDQMTAVNLLDFDLDALAAYCEQLGENRQLGGRPGLMNFW